MENGFKYFKIGDIVLNKEICGNKKFVIDKMYGNSYCPILDVHPINRDKTNGNTYLFNVSMVKLVGAARRPLLKLKKDLLLKLMKKGNLEARREFLIRVYYKKL